MQGIDIVQGALDSLLDNGASIFYDKYIVGRIPQHLTRKHMGQFGQICSEELIAPDKAISISLDFQPKPIHKDNLAPKQIQKRAESIAKSPQRLQTTGVKKRKPISRYSTRPTTAAKSMSSTVTKRLRAQEPKLIKLYEQPEEASEQRRLEDDLRKWKAIEIQKSNELAQKKMVEQDLKNKASQAALAQYNSYNQKNIKTTFGLNGNLIPVTGHSVCRKIVSLECQSSEIVRPKTLPQKKTSAKTSQNPSSQYSKNDIFTSLVYEMHSSSNSLKQYERFHINDEYNNNNKRQTSHVNVIKLQEGVSLFEPLNIIRINNPVADIKQSLHRRTATFKHFLLNETKNQKEDSSEKKRYTSHQDEVFQEAHKKEMAETQTRLQSRDSARFRMSFTNRFSSFYKATTSQSINQRKKLVERPKTSNNNGRQRIIVEANMGDRVLE